MSGSAISRSWTLRVCGAAMTNLHRDFQQAAQKAEPKYPPPFSLRLTYDERARQEAEAGGKPLGAYIRERLLGDDAAPRKRRGNSPIKIHEALARVLGALGRSRLCSNLNQLASRTFRANGDRNMPTS
jgi:hypothetical protein